MFPTALIHGFFDTATSTITHVVSCPVTRHAAVIDSVLDFDLNSGCTSTVSADKVVKYVRAHGLSVQWHLETHVHADHLSAAPYLKQQLGGVIVIGDQIAQVQKVFKAVFNASDLSTDGREFDRQVADGEVLTLGELTIRVMHTPGHTPACVTYIVGDDAGGDAFIGDTLFMPDYGTARCDFPGGDAATLYRSFRKVLALPDAMRLHLCHDYPPNDRAAVWVCTVAEQRANNIHARAGISESEFVALRKTRDASLGMPSLMLSAVQVNARAGHLPPVEDNGVAYLKIPLNQF